MKESERDKGEELLNRPSIHSRYGDGTPVFDGQQPSRIAGPNSKAEGSHTALRYDEVNRRIYQGREFNIAGNPIRDVDFTNPTYPNGQPRPQHPGPPHQHRYVLNEPKAGPSSGYKRLGPESL